MKLKDKVAIVTGSSRGIGLGVARVFVSEGARVAIVSPDVAEGEKEAAALNTTGKNAVFIQADVKDSAQIRKMIQATVDVFGRIDILVNNAGIHNFKNTEDTPEDEWDLVIDTNLRGTFLCSKYAIPHLRKPRGTIINMSSMAGLVGMVDATAYAASKGGQIALTKSMAIDLAPEIRVNVICPSFVQTPLVDEGFEMQNDPAAARREAIRRVPLRRIGTAEECGHLAAFLASEQAAFITGSVIPLHGGMTLGC